LVTRTGKKVYGNLSQGWVASSPPCGRGRRRWAAMTSAHMRGLLPIAGRASQVIGLRFETWCPSRAPAKRSQENGRANRSRASETASAEFL